MGYWIKVKNGAKWVSDENSSEPMPSVVSVNVVNEVDVIDEVNTAEVKPKVIPKKKPRKNKKK